MAKTKPGGVRIGVTEPLEFVQHLPLGSIPVATSGIQYTAVVTFGTTATEIFSTLIDPGYSLYLKELEVGLTKAITGLNGSFVASCYTYWRARAESAIPSGGFPCVYQGSWINITGTYQIAGGTLAATEDTFSGYVDTAQIPYAPVRISLMSTGVKAADATGKVKNSSYVRMVGNIIPGC